MSSTQAIRLTHTLDTVYIYTRNIYYNLLTHDDVTHFILMFETSNLTIVYFFSNRDIKH